MAEKYSTDEFGVTIQTSLIYPPLNKKRVQFRNT